MSQVCKKEGEEEREGRGKQYLLQTRLIVACSTANTEQSVMSPVPMKHKRHFKKK